MSSSDQDIGRLDMILAALPQENLPMTVSELDGYVTGLLACPDLIPPSEWLPHVWGETGDAGFPDEATAEATISAVMAHYNAVAEKNHDNPMDRSDLRDGSEQRRDALGSLDRRVHLRHALAP
ncbi:UPF0149 family protein [Paracoccus sp. (in: a-proteobacteria)]|uniref:UPF0149 family protein n=1 Tax=Paracoccus sp. TaxID=267 RepID=UPI00396C8DC7